MGRKFTVDSKIAILEKNLDEAMALYSPCLVCPRECLVDRASGELGDCGIGRNLKISSANLHFGEEPPISGIRGSGTIFLSGCNLHCVYCQNYPISQYNNGKDYTIRQTAKLMINLEKRGAHNINFVTPSHNVPLIMAALLEAYKSGLTIPLVYNSSGYDSVEMLKLLEGVIDIFMPDMRYSEAEQGKQYSKVSDYPQVNREAIKEMQRQVGLLQIEDDIAVKGLLIRHLVLPDDIAGSKATFEFIADQISAETYMAVMSQYFPAYNACAFSKIERRITEEEYEQAIDWFYEAGLSNGFIQPYMD